MEPSATTAACDRIEAALARVETALSSFTLAGSTAHRDLQRRHEQLREAAASSLLALDSLIAAADAEPIG